MSCRFSGRVRRSDGHLRAALDLEHAGRVGVLDHLVGRRVVVGDPRQVDSLAAQFGDHRHRPLDRRQHPEPEQVDLQKARVGTRVLVPHRDLAPLHRRRHDRAAVDQRPGRDDHPARVLGQVSRQPVRLSCQPRQPRPAAGQLAATRAVDVGADLLRTPSLAAARDPLDLARRQTQHLAELTDRAPGAVGGERGDQRRAVMAVALVHARDQPLADVTREVEVDVGQRGQLLVEEAADQQLVGDRVDMRQPGQEADDRGHARAPAAPRRQQRPGRVRAAHLDRDLARQLEHVVVQQKEARPARAVR